MNRLIKSRFKILLLGDEDSGKTSIIDTYIKRYFYGFVYDPIKWDNSVKFTLEVENGLKVDV